MSRDRQRAARLFGAAEALREAIATPLSPVDRSAQEQAVANVRAHLDVATFAAAWAEGRAMTLEQATSYALDVVELINSAGSVSMENQLGAT